MCYIPSVNEVEGGVEKAGARFDEHQVVWWLGWVVYLSAVHVITLQMHSSFNWANMGISCICMT